MKRLVILFVGILLSVMAKAQQPRVVEGLSLASEILGQEVKYSIILPENYYASKKAYPVVYLLHGLGDNESSWLEYGNVSQHVDAAVKKKEIVPMIYVMPQGFRSYYVNDYAGKFRYMDMFVQELVPHIDSRYRTIADKEHRATLGYSMGGFGALILPVKNPDVFTISVPLSISVRTDEQYMTEEASGWDEQWGRLFGGEGTTGAERITEYYKQHSPFHIFAGHDLTALKNIKLYIDNGDDEGTLCRSNEELHILLRDRNFPHQFRVRNGGHEFSYWHEALTNGLRFISDAVEGKPYRGDVEGLSKRYSLSKPDKLIQANGYNVLLPLNYHKEQRLYPVVYIIAQPETETGIAAHIKQAMVQQSFIPVITVFINGTVQDVMNSVIPEVEKNYRARAGCRFRALLGTGQAGTTAFRLALNPEMFTACVLLNVPLDCQALANGLASNKKALARTWLYIKTTDTSANYKSNGCAHITLREEDVYHEYRVSGGQANTEWALRSLNEALDFTQRKIHR
ncbi:MAG: esterase family protein [Cyclobacteriaceae bacterium]|nr:esterase family protein [Cyclobacteriaceae bacterium]